MEISIDKIRRWATSTELDDRFNRLQKQDPEGFYRLIVDACDDTTLLEFAKNRDSLKRQFFAWALVQRLVHYIYAPHGLPYHFSRFQGMLSLDQFKAKELERIEQVYARCCVVDEMHNSGQDEIKNLGDMILDFRHDRLLPDADTTKLLQLLDYQIELSLRPGVTFCQMRSCQTCKDWFKSWVAAGMAFETETCPFCKLGIAYPQKGGNNRHKAGAQPTQNSSQRSDPPATGELSRQAVSMVVGSGHPASCEADRSFATFARRLWRSIQRRIFGR